jgi:hypothetical protein
MNYRVDRASDEEMYFFDLRGYLVIPRVLGQAEIDACNAAIDAKMDGARRFEPGRLSRGAKALSGDSSRVELTGLLGWEPQYREPFRQLLVNPYVVSRLNEFCGKGFRLDHGPLVISAKQGAEGHRLHGSGSPFDQANWYHQQNGKIYCRGITVAWQLADCGPGDGGFCIVPGSHKTSEPTPFEVRTVDDDMGLVEQVAMKAGDLLLFAETATHGTLPWKAAHDRRSVLYKYASRAAARAVGKHFTPEERHGAWTHELTPEQQAVLYGPGVHHGGRLPILDSDGKSVWIEGAQNDPAKPHIERAKKVVTDTVQKVTKKAVKKAARKAAKQAKKMAVKQTRAAKKAVKKAGKKAVKEVAKAKKMAKRAKKLAVKQAKKTLSKMKGAAKKAKKKALKKAKKR